MSDRFKQVSACCLLLALVSVTGLAYPKIVAHSLHHSHHSADTHRSPVCFWVCTAGQIDTGFANVVEPIDAPITVLTPSSPFSLPRRIDNVTFSRGPPRS